MLESSVAGGNCLLLAKIDCHTKVVAEAANHKTRLARLQT